VTLVAVGCTFLLPFDPDVSIGNATASSFTEPSGVTNPSLTFTIRNDGPFSVWYVAFADGSGAATIWQRPANETAEWFFLVNFENLKPTRLRPGESATINVPFDQGATSYRLGVEFTGWRGYTIERWSDMVNPTLIHNNNA
jgi:hypothetical protein